MKININNMEFTDDGDVKLPKRKKKKKLPKHKEPKKTPKGR